MATYGFESREEYLKQKIAQLKNAQISADDEEVELAGILEWQRSKWLIDKWLPVGHKGQITAPEGSFKTIWLSYLGVCIASGTPIFGYRVQQGPVVMIDEETPLASLEKHLDRFSQGFGYSSYKELPIFIKSQEGFRLGRRTLLTGLLDDIERVQPRLVTMDSFLSMLPSGRQGFVENDSGTGEILRDGLNKILAAAPLCSILLTAHSKKPVSELTVSELRVADMQSLVRGHGSIVGEGCDTGYVMKKISEYPQPTRFAIITKPRRQAIPMSGSVVYIEMEEEVYGEGWAKLKEISQELIPPSEYAKALYQLFSDGKPHRGNQIRSEYSLFDKGQIKIGLEELEDHNIILSTIRPQTYIRNPDYEFQCNEAYLAELERYLANLKNPDKG